MKLVRTEQHHEQIASWASLQPTTSQKCCKIIRDVRNVKWLHLHRPTLYFKSSTWATYKTGILMDRFMINWLTNSMEHRPSCEANGSSADQEIARIVPKPKHSQQPATCPYPEPDRSSLCPQTHFSKIHFNITLPHKPESSKWSPSLGFPQENPVRNWTDSKT
jgi:hypothetical protein